MLHQPGFLLLCQPVKAVKLRVFLVMILSHIMQQVIVKIRYARLFELLVENIVHSLCRLEKSRVQLRRERKALSGIPVHKSLLRRRFTVETTVHPRGIKIGEALLNKIIYHLLRRLDID